jgi:hypothetical protein
VTNRAVIFVGEIDLICYCWEYCRGVVDIYYGRIIVICEYNGSVVSVLLE